MGHPDAGHHLRSRRGVEVRCRAQANVRGSSGVRGVAQTRNAGRGVGRAPRQARQVDSMHQNAAVELRGDEESSAF